MKLRVKKEQLNRLSITLLIDNFSEAMMQSPHIKAYKAVFFENFHRKQTQTFLTNLSEGVTAIRDHPLGS